MAVFLAILTIQNRLASFGVLEFPLRVVFLAAVLWFFSRHVISFRCVRPVASILLGIAVCVLWVAPDQLFPGYRTHWLFQNSLTGELKTSIDASLLASPMVLFFRSIRAVILVPIIEELFWRSWMMRWIIDPKFEAIPLGTWQARAFCTTVVLFALEHGSYWEVGALAGIAYGWWMLRTRSLGDCILAHAVTNAILSGYVMATGKWHYW